MSAPKQSNSNTKRKWHYICKCEKPRCIVEQKLWTIKMCKFCEKYFEYTEIPDGHECDQTLYFCEIKQCKFSTPYRKNLNRHVKQKHPATKNINQQQNKINCKICQPSNFHARNKHKQEKFNIAIQHAIPTHNWLENKIKTKIV